MAMLLTNVERWLADGVDEPKACRMPPPLLKANMPRMIAMNKLYIQWFCSDGIVRLVSKQTIPRIAFVTGAVEHSSTIKKLKWFRFRSPKNCNRINQNLLLFVFELFCALVVSNVP